MRLTTLSSWAVLGMCFALAVLLLWITHDVLHRGPKSAAHRAEEYADWDLVEDQT